jgi:iron complex outermembrane receptor protein
MMVNFQCRCVCAAVAGAALLAAATATAANGVSHFDIKAEPLAQALMEFGSQSGLVVIAPSTLTTGKQGAAVRGDMSATEALHGLLQGSSLTFARSSEGSIAIQASTEHPGDATPADDSDAIPEILVTARRKEENRQTTPISVTAMSAADIEKRGMDNVLDVARSAPSVTLIPGANYSGKSALAYIRGVGQDQFTYAFEPGVGFYIDDVYFGSVYGSIFQLADLSNVQVLRGPQGTLFGKNNEAGAILLYTPEPKGDGSGDIKVGYGTYGREFIKASFDIPLVKDVLALGIAGASNKMNGYVDRIDYACAHPGETNLRAAATAPNCIVGMEGGDDERSLRATFKWTPNNDLTVTLKGDLHDETSQPGAETVILQNPAPVGSATANYNALVALAPATVGGLNYGIGISSAKFVTGNPFTTFASYTDPSTGFTAPAVNDDRAWDVSNKIDWDTPWGFHIKNILAYQKYHAEFGNTDGTPIPTYLEDNILDHHQFSEELQFSGKALEDRLEWITGAYFDKSRGIYSGEVNLPTLEVVPGAFYGFNFTLDDPTEEKSSSVFAHGVYHFTDQFSAELGARYSADEKNQSFNHDYAVTDPAVPFFEPGTSIYPAGAGGNTSAHRVDPKVSLQYQWTPDLMSYVGYSTGYKMGGINPKPIEASDIKPFGAEKLTAYEVGTKSEWFNHHLIANVDAYISDYRDIQLSEFLPPPAGDGGTIVINAGHVRMEGVEGDFEARPLAGLQFDGSASYFNYRTLDLGDAAGQVGGPTLHTTAPFVPRWQASLGIQYTQSLRGAGSLMMRIDEAFRSLVYFDLANTPGSAQSGYGLTSAHLSWTGRDHQWTAAVEVANLTNKLYYVTKTPALNADGSLFSVNGTPGLPRTEFFTIDRHF